MAIQGLYQRLWNKRLIGSKKRVLLPIAPVIILSIRHAGLSVAAVFGMAPLLSKLISPGHCSGMSRQILQVCCIDLDQLLLYQLHCTGSGPASGSNRDVLTVIADHWLEKLVVSSGFSEAERHMPSQLQM